MNHFQDFTPCVVYGILINDFISVALTKTLTKRNFRRKRLISFHISRLQCRVSGKSRVLANDSHHVHKPDQREMIA